MSLRSRIAGRDGAHTRALPADEFLHPIPLAALVILIANDWWLKPSAWASGAITGKLSDVAGLVFFPLLLTASWNCLAYGVHKLGIRNDFSLRRHKIAVAVGSTALGFALIKLSPSANAAAVAVLRALGQSPVIVLDPSDLAALPALTIPWLLARRRIACVPLGRLEVLLHKPGPAADGLRDVVACGGSEAATQRLAEAIDFYKQSNPPEAATAIDRALGQLRGE